MLIRHIRFDSVIASDLVRARQTAELAFPGHDIQTDARIREYGMGSLEGCTNEHCIKEYGAVFYTNEFAAFGGESPEMVSARVADFMGEMEQKEAGPYRGAKIAVVGHAGSILHILCYALDCTIREDKIPIDNTSITKIRYEDGAWTLCFFQYSGTIE